MPCTVLSSLLLKIKAVLCTFEKQTKEMEIPSISKDLQVLKGTGIKILKAVCMVAKQD